MSPTLAAVEASEAKAIADIRSLQAAVEAAEAKSVTDIASLRAQSAADKAEAVADIASLRDLVEQLLAREAQPAGSGR